MMRITLLRSLVGFGVFAAFVGCSGSAATDGPGGSLGGSGNAGGSAAAGSGGVGGSGVGGSGVGGSAGRGGASAAGSGGSGTVCGARAGDACSANEYCAYTAGQLCGAADASSTCQERPGACDDIYMPVCGCDNKTYPSSCDAALHGQGVNTAGVCK